MSMWYVELVVMVALLAAFIVLLVKKWGVAEWMQIHGDKYLSKLFSWAAMILCMGMCCWEDEMFYLFVPMFSTPISRMLV